MDNAASNVGIPSLNLCRINTAVRLSLPFLKMTIHRSSKHSLFVLLLIIRWRFVGKQRCCLFKCTTLKLCIIINNNKLISLFIASVMLFFGLSVFFLVYYGHISTSGR